jgi:hypothetical protein
MLPFNFVGKGRVTRDLTLKSGDLPENDLCVGGGLNDLRPHEHANMSRAYNSSRTIGSNASVVPSIPRTNCSNEEASRLQNLKSTLWTNFFRFWREGGEENILISIPNWGFAEEAP